MSSSIGKWARVAVLGLIVAVGSAGVAFSQEGGKAGGGDTGGAGRTGDTRQGRDFNWGWLGLIGLAGLTPLFIRRNGHADRYNTTTGGGMGAR